MWVFPEVESKPQKKQQKSSQVVYLVILTVPVIYFAQIAMQAFFSEKGSVGSPNLLRRYLLTSGVGVVLPARARIRYDLHGSWLHGNAESESGNGEFEGEIWAHDARRAMVVDLFDCAPKLLADLCRLTWNVSVLIRICNMGRRLFI